MPDDVASFGFVQASPTASMTVSAGQSGVFPVAFGYYPAEGPRAVAAQYDWTGQTAYAEDLSQLVARGVETTIQSVFVDNSTVGEYVTLTVAGTGQVVSIQPYCQGLFPLFFTGTPAFTLTVSAATPAVTRLTLLNVPPTAAGLWAGAAGGGAVVGPFLPIAGGVMQGPITLSGDATQPLHAVSLEQVTTIVGGPYLPLSGFATVAGPVTFTQPLTLSGAGTLTLAGNAVSALQAVPLQQVNSASVGGPFLPTAGGTLTGATTVSATGNSPLNAINTSMAYPPRLPPNNVFRQIYAQQGNESAETQFAYLYPNNNRSQSGVITATLAIPASGVAGGPAPQQSPLYASVVNYDVGSNVAGIAATLTAFAAVSNGLAYGLNTQCVDTITAGDSASWPNITNVRLQNEYDYFVHNATTSVRGNLQVLYATALASSGANLIANAVGLFAGSTEVWGVGYYTGNGCSYVGMQLGSTAITQVTGLSSQPIQLGYTNNTTASTIYGLLTAVPAGDNLNGDLYLSGTSGSKFGLKVANGVALKSLTTGGVDQTMAYVNASNVLVLGDGIGQTVIRAATGSVLECLNTGTAFNDVRITSVANGSAPIIAANKAAGGADTNIGLWLRGFGNGTLFLQAGVTGPLQVGAGVFTANGSTALSLTALGPAAAHATVQEWFTVTNSAGTVRYIPAF